MKAMWIANNEYPQDRPIKLDRFPLRMGPVTIIPINGAGDSFKPCAMVVEKVDAARNAVTIRLVAARP